MDRARVVEECFWELAELLDVELERRDGWVAIEREGAGDSRNGVLRAELDPEEADGAIEATIERFGETPFRWHVGPSSKPADLAARLEAHGLARCDTLAGMCLPTSRDVASPDPSIEITELEPHEREAFVDVVMSGFGAPPEVRAALLADLDGGPGAERQRHWVARIDGRMVGATSLARMRHGGFLQGATVLEPYRGRGVYTQLIQRRLEALREGGIELAVITARHATSAPICAHLGFDEVCTIEIYRHPPEVPAAHSR